MKPISYLYYRLKKLTPDEGDGLMALKLSGLWALHILAALPLIDTIFDIKSFDSFGKLIDDENPFIRRFVKIPIVMAPLLLLTYLFVRINKTKLEERYIHLSNMSLKKRRRMNVFLWVYILCSFCLCSFRGYRHR